MVELLVSREKLGGRKVERKEGSGGAAGETGVRRREEGGREVVDLLVKQV